MVREKMDIMGIPVDRITMNDSLELFKEFLKEGSFKFIATPNSEIVYAASKSKELTDIFKSADLLLPDGIGLVLASKKLGHPLSERVTGIDFSRKALEIAAEENISVFFFGAKPGVAQLAADKLCKEIPSLNVAGVHDGYFKPEEEEAIADTIARSGAGFLLVALGSPKQEEFIYRHKDKFKALVAIGIGGSFDVWSGVSNRAPEFFCKHGLEWLYRLYKEPGRIGRMSKIPVFLLKVHK